MDLAQAFRQLICSPWFPPRLSATLLGTLSAGQAARQLRADRRALCAGTAPFLDQPLYLLDGCHGGMPFWDWIMLPRGGLWQALLWPAVGEVLVRRALELGLPAVLELDGYTYGEMARRQPRALARLRRAVAAGTIEVVNGTYAQPFLDVLSGEAAVRHFAEGLETVERALGVQVVAYASQEPCFTPQLPQLLAGFGLQHALLRTHWAPFGHEAGHDAPLVRWAGPDGSWVLAVPRHTWMDYETRRDVQPGAARGNVTGAHISLWQADGLRRLHAPAAASGSLPLLISKLEDLAPPHAPTPQAVALAKAPHVRLTTLSGYVRAAQAGRPVEALPLWRPQPEDLSLTLPWGLEGDALAAAQGEAEAALLTAERADALAHVFGAASAAERLQTAWQKLLLAQHHDLQVCGPWLSRRHGEPMSAVGCDLCTGAQQAAQAVTQEALARLLAALDTSGCRGRALLVFNPEAQPRRAMVRVAQQGEVHDGEPSLPVQADGGGMVFTCDLPALGWRTFDLRPAPLLASDASTAPGPFANAFYEAALGADGGLTLCTQGQTVLQGGTTLAAWHAGEWWDSRRGVQVVEETDSGPVFTRWHVRGSLGPLEFEQNLTLYRALPHIDITTTVDFGDGVLFGPQPEDGEGYYGRDELKLCGCFPVGAGRVLRGAPFLAAVTAQARFAGAGWTAVEHDGVGLALVARGPRGYAYDSEAGLLRRVLGWSPAGWMYASADSVHQGSSPHTILRGQHTFHTALAPYGHGRWALAEALALPPAVAVSTPASGALPAQGSLLAVEGARLSALWVQGDATYARLWNAADRGCEAKLSGAGGLRLQAVDLRLQGGTPLPGAHVPLRPWGVQTVRLGGLAPGCM